MADNCDVSSILTYLRCNKRLEREKGISELKQLVDSGYLSSIDQDQLESKLTSILSSSDGPWEEKQGALMASCLLVEKNKAGEVFMRRLMELVPSLLENIESRVRITTGELIGYLCRNEGIKVYEELQNCLLEGIRDNIERDTLSGDVQLVEKLRDGQIQEREEERPSSPSASDIFHDTAGWKNLETYMNGLQHAVEGCGSSFEPHITSNLLDLLFTALKHTNRFVRETGYKVLAAIVKCPGLSQETKDKYWNSVAQQLAEGLADNWSQVRMSASVATREFLSHIEPEDSLHQYFPYLIPPMCLNRYYVAEGVRLYSQETWRQITQGEGVKLVERYIENVVSFYILESQAANHAVREAACACIAELGTKVSQDCLRKYIGQLIGVLLECFQDDSWPVRDAACLACGNFVTCFPEECRPRMKELFPLFLGNLEDSIPSVRQGAAVAIGSVVKTYGYEMVEKAIDIIKERLPLVAEQPTSVDDDSSPLHPGMESGPAVFGVVKRVRDNDVDAHSNQQMYSCGSLAPKMKRGGGGCMHSDFHKPAQPWEKSEGCVHLMGELSQLEVCRGKVASLLPVLAETTRHRQYIQHCHYFETVMKQLPVIAKSLGKRIFKQYLELFFDAIFYGLMSSNSPQLKITSSECLEELTKLIGSMVMKGRVESYNPLYLNYLTSFQRTI